MTPILDNAQLGTDLDCQNMDILNVRFMTPVPPGLVDNTDPVWYDRRVPPFASVTNESVSDAAGIQQGKFLFNGPVPASWLGTGTTQAAPGNLVERVAHKGAPNGYAALDSTGKVPSAHFSPTANPGTVSSVGLVMPSELFSVAGSPITTSGTFLVNFNRAQDQTWFGVNGPVGLDPTLKPSFLPGQLPLGLVPSLSAAKFTTGPFSVDQLPVAAGMGSGHSGGILPDTGATGDLHDYIGRDMQWHAFDGSIPYQPRCSMPGIVLGAWDDTSGLVRISISQKDASLFYRVSNPESIGVAVLPFILVPEGNIAVSVPNNFYVEAYSAKSGYNNSNIASYTVAIPTST